MGIGMALTEETAYDPQNRPAGDTRTWPNTTSRRTPTSRRSTSILSANRTSPSIPIGARGMGEIGITGIAAAIANAVYHATGKRMRDLPITQDKLI